MKCHKIKILPYKVIKYIAAGEVIERPSSVVKELLENSIDAKSKNIKIFIEDGGKKSILILDDGHGMHKEDLLNAFERFATSKIESEEDVAMLKDLDRRYDHVGGAQEEWAQASYINHWFSLVFLWFSWKSGAQ